MFVDSLGLTSEHARVLLLQPRESSTNVQFKFLLGGAFMLCACLQAVVCAGSWPCWPQVTPTQNFHVGIRAGPMCISNLCLGAAFMLMRFCQHLCFFFLVFGTYFGDGEFITFDVFF